MRERDAFRALTVGGSVGGVAAAHELRAVGADIAVYERSPGHMRPRGAGIVMQPEVEALPNRLDMSGESVGVELQERRRLDLHGEATRHRALQLMTRLRAATTTPLTGARVEGSTTSAPCDHMLNPGRGPWVVGER
ncbi:hypothetical protein ACSDR0_27535 [Streptosporangium sp. G11]|uniref:hypothetical protein n=1 Tax=Streptosporangium sp. G11 TaxID=3436926 RepID=UPI003EBF5419